MAVHLEVLSGRARLGVIALSIVNKDLLQLIEILRFIPSNE